MLRVTLRIALRILSVEEECARKEREMARGLREAGQVQQTTRNEENKDLILHANAKHVYTYIHKQAANLMLTFDKIIYLQNALNR